MVGLGVRRSQASRRSRKGRVIDPARWTKLTQSELRVAQTEILDAFADFCAAHQLRYFLYAGTLLGSVRHQGFIPWDDDIDVVMPRRDYDRLHSLASGPTAVNGFTLYSSSATPGFPWPYAKVVSDRGTMSIEPDGVDYLIGINIDVFPLDGWPAGLATRWFHDKYLRLLRGLIYCHHQPPEFKPSNRTESVLKLVRPAARLVPLDWLVRKVSSRASRYLAEDGGLVGVTVWGYPERVAAQTYSGAVELRFEERRYPVPSGYDTVLTVKYGDYMRPPPPELQVSPHAIEAFRLS